MKNESGIELNRRGIPARKRKKNSLIYGADDLVSIPVKSPKKRGGQKLLREPEKTKQVKPRVSKYQAEVEDDESEDEYVDELEEHENNTIGIEKSINFYEDNIDEPNSPIIIKIMPKNVKEVKL